jgi:hypothetical protein
LSEAFPIFGMVAFGTGDSRFRGNDVCLTCGAYSSEYSE